MQQQPSTVIPLRRGSQRAVPQHAPVAIDILAGGNTLEGHRIGETIIDMLLSKVRASKTGSILLMVGRTPFVVTQDERDVLEPPEEPLEDDIVVVKRKGCLGGAKSDGCMYGGDSQREAIEKCLCEEWLTMTGATIFMKNGTNVSVLFIANSSRRELERAAFH